MHEFIAKHQDKIAGTLSGFDRLVLRGTLRSITFPDGLRHYLHANDVLLKNFGSHVERVSLQLKQASSNEAKQLGRPVRYLNSSQVSKEEIARAIQAKDGIREGLICVLRCVEPCWSFQIHRNQQTKKLELDAAPQVHVHLSVPHPSNIRLHECADPDMVPLCHSDLHQRPRVAGAANGPERNQVRRLG